MERITSRQNPLMAHIRKLSASRGYREKTGEYLGDGVKLLEEASRWGAALTAVVCTPGTALPALPVQTRLVEVPEELMAYISPMDAPQGALFLARQPSLRPPERLSGCRYLALEGVQDPGNVGTILRTADAFHTDGLFLVNGCADLYNPKTVRATMGAVFRCPVWSCKPEEVLELLESSGLPLYGAALRDDTADVRDVDYRRCAVAIGSEGRGLSAQMLQGCTRTVRIPMSAHCESLNAAAATAVLLWEAARGD